MTCESSTPPCGRCTIDGLARVDGRCNTDPTTACTTIDGGDGECKGAGLCDAFFLPPLHNMWGGGPSCFVERLTTDVTGFVDNETGASELSATIAGVDLLPSSSGLTASSSQSAPARTTASLPSSLIA